MRFSTRQGTQGDLWPPGGVATIYITRKEEDIERKSGSVKKRVVTANAVKEASEAKPLKSLRSHAKNMGVAKSTFHDALRAWKGGGEEPDDVEEATPHRHYHVVHIQCCQVLLNNLKSTRANRVIIFSVEKTWMVNPVRNRHNERYTTFGSIDDSIPTLMTMKHHASVMSLGFVASNGIAAPLIWFPTGYRRRVTILTSSPPSSCRGSRTRSPTSAYCSPPARRRPHSHGQQGPSLP